MQFPVGNMDEFGDIAAQVEQGVEFDRALGSTKSRPWKQRQAQIDCACIERVHRLVQLDAKVLVGIQPSGLGNEHLGEVGIDAPVAILVGVGECAAGDSCTDAHVIESGLHCTQASHDIAQASPVG